MDEYEPLLAWWEAVPVWIWGTARSIADEDVWRLPEPWASRLCGRTFPTREAALEALQEK